MENPFMPDHPQSIPGAFQYGGIWFLTDLTIVQVPHAVSCPALDFLELARSDERLPDLAGAPVASWLLARISSMTRGRMPYRYDQVQGSDGNDFYAGFTCHREDGTVVGSVAFLACADHIRLHAQAVPPTSPESLRNTVVKAVLSNPHKVARSRVTVTWTDGTDDAAKHSIPRVYGFEEDRYLDELAPQHTIDWSEYE
jgi:hypothetical protein